MNGIIEILYLIACGPKEWKNAPAPKRGPFLVRSRDSKYFTLHDDNWLLKEIHGNDYQWALPNKENPEYKLEFIKYE